MPWLSAIKRLDQGTDPADGAAAAWQLDEAHSDRLAEDWQTETMQSTYPDNSDPQELRDEG